METLLVHKDLLDQDIFQTLCNSLKDKGVKLFSGPKLHKIPTFDSPLATSLNKEYGSLECTIEIVDNVNEAINHINNYGSGHTDVIVTENGMLFYYILNNI